MQVRYRGRRASPTIAIPHRFLSILVPDLFRASAYAIDMILTEGPEAAIASNDGFLDFTSKQRKLLTALAGKENVPVEEVLRTVYGSRSGDKLQALLKLKDRTNAELSTKRRFLKIRKKGETLSLRTD